MKKGLIIVLIILSGCLLLVVGFRSLPNASSLALNQYPLRLLFEHSMTLTAGQIRVIDIILDTQKDNPGEVTYSIFRLSSPYPQGSLITSGLSFPMGMEVSIKPARFAADNNQVYHSSLTLETTPDLLEDSYFIDLIFNSSSGIASGGLITVNVMK